MRVAETDFERDGRSRPHGGDGKGGTEVGAVPVGGTEREKREVRAGVKHETCLLTIIINRLDRKGQLLVFGTSETATCGTTRLNSGKGARSIHPNGGYGPGTFYLTSIRNGDRNGRKNSG